MAMDNKDLKKLNFKKKFHKHFSNYKNPQENNTYKLLTLMENLYKKLKKKYLNQLIKH